MELKLETAMEFEAGVNKSSALMDFPGVITPPSSEAGSRCASTDFSLAKFDVNNTNTTPFPQSPPTPPAKSRRDLQKEANRSRQFTTRLRSTTNGSDESDVPLGRDGRRRKFQPKRHSLPSHQNQTEEALKAVEALHDPVFRTKMAFAEQQKWITVQQKTFTKWCVYPWMERLANWGLIVSRRLNTKIEPRELVVKDLVQDLSDGVNPLIHQIASL